MCKTKPKFTLIELLVAIAIIGILISILLPSLSKARDKTYITICLNNLSNAGIALHLYTSENNGFYPPRKVAGDGRSKLIWMGKTGQQFQGESAYSIENRFLNIYLGDYSEGDEMIIAKCPKGIVKYEFKGSSYRANNTNLWKSLATGTNTTINSAQIKSPSRMAAMNEFGVINIIRGNNVSDEDQNHNDKMQNRWTNLFTDGHVAMTSFFSGLINSDKYVFEWDQ